MEKYDRAKEYEAAFSPVSDKIVGESTASVCRSMYASNVHSIITPGGSHIRHPVFSIISIQTRDPTLEFFARRGVFLHYQGIVTRNHVIARIRQLVGAAVTLQNVAGVEHDRVGDATLNIGVEMRCVGSQHHPAAPR